MMDQSYNYQSYAERSRFVLKKKLCDICIKKQIEESMAQTISEDSILLFEKAKGKNVLRGMIRSVLIGVCLYKTCQKNNVTISVEDICDYFDINSDQFYDVLNNTSLSVVQ